MSDVSVRPNNRSASAMETLPRSTYSETELSARVELAALYRLCDLYGMTDLANGAIGARVPGTDHFLTHPYGMFWEEATASAFVTIDHNGQPVHGDTRWLNDGAVNLCRWIFDSRPEIDFFVHGHDTPVAAVASTRTGLLEINQPAVYLGHMLDYIDYEFDEDDAFAARICELFAHRSVVISRNHGYWTLGRSAGEAFFRAYFLRQACEVQIAAASTGQPLHVIGHARSQIIQPQMYASDSYNYDGATEWPGLIRKLDRECRGWRD